MKNIKKTILLSLFLCMQIPVLEAQIYVIPDEVERDRYCREQENDEDLPYRHDYNTCMYCRSLEDDDDFLESPVCDDGLPHGGVVPFVPVGAAPFGGMSGCLFLYGVYCFIRRKSTGSL